LISSPITNCCPLCNHRRNDGCKPSRDGHGWLCLRSTAEELTGEDGVRYLRTKDLRDQMGGLYLPARDKERTTARQKRAQPTADHRLIHQLIWDTASEELGGRFAQKLRDAAIKDSYYCRYLSQEAIESIERLVEHRVTQGVFTQAQILISGHFRLNTGFEGHRFKLKIPIGRILAVHSLEGELVAIRANPEVPLWLYNHKKEKYEEYKYLQAKGIPLHPHFPKVSRARLKELWANDEPYLLIISEGEDTTESPAQNLQLLGDLPVVFASLPGVEGWINSSGQPRPNYASWLDDLGHLHPELKKVISHAAHVVLGFDSDVMGKKEVKWAMNRLGQAIWHGFEGKIVPLVANWPALLRSHPELKQRKYGLDDLLGELVSRGESVAPIFEDLLAPSNAAMIRRTWQRLGKSCAINHPPLLTVDQAYQATEKAIGTWMDGSGPQHIVLASTAGTGKTQASSQMAFEKLQNWVKAGHDILAFQLQQEIRALQAQKKAMGYLKGRQSFEYFELLAQTKAKRQQLQTLYQETLGGPMVLLLPNLQALSELRARIQKLNEGTDPFWLGLRTGRETPDPEIKTKDQMGIGSLVCAHHEPVSQIGSQAHSPSALACSTCFFGQEGSCGFLDSIEEAHLAPVVLATAQAVLNASEELANYSQVIIDEDLSHHLYGSTRISDHLPKLINNLSAGIRLGLWDELYEPEVLEKLLTVLGEVETARLRYQCAPRQLIEQRGERVTHWMDREIVNEPLEDLKKLRPLRMNMDTLQPTAATYYPWERPRYTHGESGKYLHVETHGDEQQLAFDDIPLRGTDALLEVLRYGLLDSLPGANLTFESDYDPQTKKQQTHIHLCRPYEHLIEILNAMRVLNTDATPNSLLLRTFLPNADFEYHDAELNLEILQILSGPPGKIGESQIKELVPALRVFGKKSATLLMTSKQAVGWVKETTQNNPIEGLISMASAQGEMFPGAYYGYHDRAFDDPAMKSANTLVLAGAYLPHLGHLKRVAMMLKRYLAVHKRTRDLPKNQEPYRVHSYGPEGYELIEESKDPLLDLLIQEERTAALLQGISRPRPVRREEKLTVVLYRSDPVPEPYNRYVRVLGSVEELFGVSLTLKNKANAGRLVEAWHRHGEAILKYFLEHRAVPSAREIQKIAGGSRGRSGSITRALAWFSAQVLPFLPALPETVGGTEEAQQLYEQFQKSLLEAAEQYFLPVLPASSPYELDEECIESYWVERYQQGNASQRIVCWVCTRQLSIALQKKLEQIEPFAKLMGNLSPHVPQPQARKRPP
jgi:Domain of unknown function (DUF3854)